MTLRLLPWAVFAAVIAGLAFFTPELEKGVPVSASQRGERKGLLSLEIRLEPVDMREFQDGDDAWNRLVASEALYSYTERTIWGKDVTVSIEAEKDIKKIGESRLWASRAFWDFDRKRIDLPDGGQAESTGGWKGNLTPAVFDLETRILRVPGNISLDGPGLTIVGGNLRWNWLTGKISLDSPVSKIKPSSLPVRMK